MTSYLPGIVISVAAHGLLVFLVAWGWQNTAPPPVKTPSFVKATLVELDNKQRPKPKKVVKPKPKPQVDAIKKQREQALAKQKAAKEKAAKEKAAKAKAKAAKEKAAKEKAAKEKRAKELAEKKRKEAQRKKAEALKQQREQAFADALAKEQAALEAEEQALEDEVASQSYNALIAARIEQNWSRPPSARRGMIVELYIRMVPNGQVIDVKVTKGSGNQAFDRSAVQAVKRVERFPEVKDMPSRVFEKYFREFKLVFNPKDLRL